MRLAVEPPHIVSACEGTPARSVPLPDGKEQRSWIGWAPLALLPMMAMMLRAKLPWVFMWLLAIAVFAGCKWQTWWEARAAGDSRNWKRSAAYLLLWPGMEAREFFAVAGETRSTPASAWLSGVAKTLAGIVVTGAGARVVALGHPLVGGWTGLVGLALFLHFGTFHLIALAWQRAGVRVKPIMQRPLASRSLSELWGKRWNLGFRKLTHSGCSSP